MNYYTLYQETMILIVLTISILIGQEPPAYFEKSRDFVDKLDYSIICYPITSADYAVRSAHCAPLAKEREHLRVTASKDRAKLEINPKIKILRFCQNKAYHKPD